MFAFDNRGYVERKGFSVSANLLTTRAVFDPVGGFREGVSEDLDWCRRAIAAGARLAYADDLRVAHPSRADWPALERKWRRLAARPWGSSPARRGAARLGGEGAAHVPSAAAHAPRVLRSPGSGTAANGAAARDAPAAQGGPLRLDAAAGGGCRRRAPAPPPPRRGA